ncbi:MAG: hypothetical protein ACHQYP_10060 [Nitrospiria bacterium]
MEQPGTFKPDEIERVAMNMAEGVITELEKEEKVKKKGKEMSQHQILFKGVQLYTGMVLTLAGAVLSTGRAGWFVMVLTSLLFFTEIFEIPFLSEKKRFPAQMVLTASIVLIGIFEVIETIGKNFNLDVFYLLISLLGGVLMLIELARTGYSKTTRS